MSNLNKMIVKGGVHYVGTKRFIDMETGEEFNAQTIVKSVGGSDFKKMLIGAILEKIDVFSFAKLKFILWFLDNADRQNRVIGTLEKLSKESGVSYATAARLIPVLKSAGIIKNETQSVYMLNPDIVTCVTSQKRNSLLVKYSDLNK